MSREPLDRIRRCLKCSNKTHHSEWSGGNCPVCGACKGWVPSSHGQLSKEEIPQKRRTIIDNLERKKNSRGLNEIEQGRLRWLLGQEKKERQSQAEEVH